MYYLRYNIFILSSEAAENEYIVIDSILITIEVDFVDLNSNKYWINIMWGHFVTSHYAYYIPAAAKLLLECNNNNSSQLRWDELLSIHCTIEVDEVDLNSTMYWHCYYSLLSAKHSRENSNIVFILSQQLRCCERMNTMLLLFLLSSSKSSTVRIAITTSLSRLDRFVTIHVLVRSTRTWMVTLFLFSQQLRCWENRNTISSMYAGLRPAYIELTIWHQRCQNSLPGILPGNRARKVSWPGSTFTTQNATITFDLLRRSKVTPSILPDNRAKKVAAFGNQFGIRKRHLRWHACHAKCMTQCHPGRTQLCVLLEEFKRLLLRSWSWNSSLRRGV